ncbi:hypothetical protein [Saccharospirillum impatiens]|uniref:hypothetical protein n=1 Tax=Saccharospirillum impatiens TaxID=169438 RepID=UPI000410F2CC|nr:hypothetical protein [Saccharospirillum impatiens]
MTRRTWRDLEQDSNPTTRGPSAQGPDNIAAISQRNPSDLAAATQLAPNSGLNQLLAQRNALEAKLRGLTGEAEQDAAISQRFPVASFAERRQQEQAWAAQRAAVRQRQQQGVHPSPPGQPRGSLPASPLEGRMDAGMAGRSGLSQGADNRFATANRQARSGLRRIGEALTPPQSISQPLGDVRQSVDGARDQLRDLDQQLASEGVSDRERAEIRDTLQGDRLDKTSAVLNRAQSALDAPKRAVDRVESGWLAREQQLTGAMDRFSRYADRREQRLSVDRGGSGDLFERMQANRQRALARRREQQQAEQRDQRRRERALANQRERSRESDNA